MANGPRKLSVIVISMGRPDCLNDIARCLNAQTRQPDRILFVVPSATDVSLDPDGLDTVPEVIITTQGTCHQRNVGIDALDHDTGIVAFLDDDYVPAPNALEAIEKAFENFGPTVAGMSGHLIADGIHGQGFSFDEAQALIASHQAAQPSDFLSNAHFDILKDTIGLYGCNMALRVEAIGPTRFDTALPLYAWQEDVDFSHRVARHAGTRMVLTNAFSGVHRGVKSGRESRGTRLGYSQVANNWYLWKNSNLPAWFACKVALRNVLANHAKAMRSEPWIDRRGRARGNRLALVDIALGKADPQRIHDL